MIIIKGIVIQGSYVYQHIAKVYPIKKDYGDGYFKWICPVCNQLGNNHQLQENIKNCPACNVNLHWDIGRE